MVLESHKRIGKRFVPPFLQLGPIQESSWVNRLLPELLWIGILNERYGIGRGAALCAELAALGQELLEAAEKRAFLCFISSYDLFSDEELGQIRDGLSKKGMRHELDEALVQFCTAYPKCPLSFLIDSQSELSEGAAYMRGLLPNLLVRWEAPATFVQVHAVYMAIVQGRLFVRRNLPLANFPAVKDYPDTEESKKIASSCRATVNMLIERDDTEGEEWWPGYFWNRGLELEPCRPMSFGDSDDEA